MLTKASLLISIFVLSFIVTCPLGYAMPGAIVAVDPKESKVKVGQTFAVNINITDVYELRGFDFRVSYCTTLLKLLSVEEGTFLKSVGSTFTINLTTEGVVWFAVVLYDPQGLEVSANGSGILATITFKAIAVGTCSLDLHSIDPCRPDEIKLAKDPPETIVHIPNIAIDGSVVVAESSDPDPPPDPPGDPPSDPPTKSPDINGDGKVSISDLAVVARAFGSSPVDSRWDEMADLDNDQDVDIADLHITAKNFGTSI